MADLRYRVDVDTKTAQNNLSAFKATIASVGTALAAVGVGKLVKSFVDVGSSVENLGLRFKFLFGSAEEGAKAFDNLTKFASKVPFSLQEIEKASGNLAVVAKDADDLNNLLEITGNVAAVTGLDFKTTGEQIQRAFSGGIASADIFRDKGVRSMLGFEEGAKVSIEQTIKRFQEVFGKGGKFGNATNEFANTLAGTLSMLGDKFFTFQKQVAEGFFDELKFQLGDLNKFFEQNADVLEEFAESIGEGLATAIQGTVEVIKFLKENIDAVKAAFVALAIGKFTALFLTLANSIRTTATAMGVLNVVMGKNPFIKIISGVLAAGGALAYYFNKTSDATKAQEAMNESQKDFQKFLDKGGEYGDGVISKKTVKETQAKAEAISQTIKKLQKEIREDFDKTKSSLELDATLNQFRGFDKELQKIEIQEQKNAEAIKRRIAEQTKDVDEKQIKKLIDEVDANTKTLIEAQQKIARETREIQRDFSTGWADAMDDYVENATNGAQQARRIFEQATQGMEDAIIRFVKTGKFNFKDLINDLLTTLLRSRLQELFARIFGGAGARSNSPGLFDVLGSVASSIGKFVGFKGDGGMIGKGEYGIAGERGPELITGPANVTPLMGNQVTYNINAVDAASFQELLARDPQFLFAVSETGRQSLPQFSR
jgi:lambda family phage tail tape measure protein